MEVANTLAYYETATITAVKSFKVEALGACTINYFRLQLIMHHNKLECLSL
jgi:hypothetical protein